MITSAASQRWTLHNIGHRPVVSEEIEVYRGQPLHRMTQITGQAHGFKKDLRQYHSRAEVQIDTVGEGCDYTRQGVEVSQASVAKSFPIRLWMHMNDIRANGNVCRDRNSDARGSGKNAEFLMF